MKLVTNNFKTHIAKQFIESVSESENTIYYLGAHRSLPFINDALPPNPETDLQSTFYSLYDELIFGKHITNNDVIHMIRNIPWVAGTVYEMYDSRLTLPETKNFYVVSLEAGSYHVFKCLNNNGGIASTSQPKRSDITPADDFYKTADGYEWKFMYSITAAQYLKFATNEYVPVYPNQDVINNAIPGSIDIMIIEDSGSQYKSYVVGNIKEAAIGGDPLIYSIESSDMTLSANATFYENCSIYIKSGPGDGEIRTIVDYFTSGGERKIVIDSPFETVPDRTSDFTIAPRVIISGDGAGAKARCDVDLVTGSISDVIIIQRGEGYSYADVQVIGGTGSTSAVATTSAVVRPIVSPPGGHGFDVVNELYASRIGIGIELHGTEALTIPAVNNYRKISVIKDPLFHRANLTLNSTATIDLVDGETITQPSTNASATILDRFANTVVLTNVHGFFTTSNTSDSTTGIIGSTSGIVKYINAIDRTFETFDQRSKFTTEIIDFGLSAYSGFIEDEIVVQSGLTETLSSSVIRLALAGNDTAYLFTDGEIVIQTTETGISSGIITARAANILTLTNYDGYFTTNAAITGSTSGATAMVTNYDNTFAAVAIGNVHEVAQANSTIVNISLTDVNGTFLLTDTATNTINSFRGQTSQAVASLLAIDSSSNKLVDRSGEFIYVENFIPIDRSYDQTERIKLIIEF